ncbi:mitochondrial carrier [Terfezia boudieri ATCC MYA-4762]|uniref:Mitochondrial carrier n=1 Tax=Terfezia boudieri ATCC MYA-4762 TaxID=1051890 RepID=A0A3N4LQ73_9PEZI|nr:mitochondrial carrier [Terfezia boudieri ATCC MYA-4762]
MGAQSKEAALPPWGDAVAGAFGAVVANALVYPLDIIKTRIQVQVKPKAGKQQYLGVLKAEQIEHFTSTIDAFNKILLKEGPSGLYAGMVGSLIGVASTNFAYFYWYTLVRSFYLSKLHANTTLSTAAELSLGAVAGALAQLFTIPVAVITTRQQTSAKYERKGLIETAKDVIAEDGLSGLWRGLKASLVLVINPSITYGAYQRLHAVLFPGKARLNPYEAFLLGAMSKTLATLATQPLIVAKVGLQSKPPSGAPQFKTFGQVMAYIVKHEGAMSLFKGIGPQITKGLLVQGFLMMTKERMELLFILLWRVAKKMHAQSPKNG